MMLVLVYQIAKPEQTNSISSVVRLDTFNYLEDVRAQPISNRVG